MKVRCRDRLGEHDVSKAAVDRGVAGGADHGPRKLIAPPVVFMVTLAPERVVVSAKTIVLVV